MSTQLRIGDAERDAAVERLGEHFAAGRLTKEEFDERAARATEARYDDDLRPLFNDLPSPERSARPAIMEGGWPGSRAWNGREWPPREWRSGTLPMQRFHPVLLIPVFLFGMAVVSLVLFATPWLLIPLFWIAACGAGRGHRHRRTDHHPATGVGHR